MRRFCSRLLLMALPVLWGCQYRTESGKEVLLEATDKFPAFDAYLTWTHFSHRDSRFDAAHLIWNGEDLGTGREARQALLERLRRLPVRSRVLIYPSYYLEWQRRLQMGTDHPFLPIYPQIVDIMVARKLTLYYSPWDHLGHLHPDCIEPSAGSLPGIAPSSTRPGG
jgi:hypothetical protein